MFLSDRDIERKFGSLSERVYVIKKVKNKVDYIKNKSEPEQKIPFLATELVFDISTLGV